MASKAQKQERDRFMMIVGSECGRQHLDNAEQLISIARRMNRLNELWANGDIDEATFERRDNALTKKAEAIAQDMGLKIDTQGDPRGYPLLLHFPSGEYNTWGGKEHGYGVPC
jgi:hypothetical protein